MNEPGFVYGNGPSLKSLPRDLLRMKHAFWVNRGFRVADVFNLEFRPQYYLVSDPISFVENSALYLSVQAGQKYFRRDVYGIAVSHGVDVSSVQPFEFHVAPTMNESEDNFAKSLETGVYRGFTVVLDAIQIAFCLGYRTVYVAGVDLDYETPYFFDGPPPGQRMPIDNVAASFITARKHFEKHGGLLAKLTDSPKLPLNKVLP